MKNRTTWLLYLERLPEQARSAFIAGVVDRYVSRYPPADDCIHIPTILPYLLNLNGILQVVSPPEPALRYRR